jgi:hypothetical protein
VKRILPLRRHADPGDQGEEDGDRHPDPPGVTGGHLLVAGDHLVLGRHRALRAEAGRQPVGDQQVRVDDQEEHDREHGRRDDLGREEAAPGAALAQGVEPQRIDVEAGETAQAEQQDDQDDDDRDHPAAHAESASLLGRHAHGGSLSDAHRHSGVRVAVRYWASATMHRQPGCAGGWV